MTMLSFDTLPLSDKLYLNELCNDFERIPPEDRPSIEGLLGNVDKRLRGLALQELLILEWDSPGADTSHAALETYVDRFREYDRVVYGVADTWFGGRIVDDHDPEAFGRYEVERLIGEGAFGKVYLANDTELSRSVAIKAPKSMAFQRGHSRSMIADEARIAAGISHPSIVTIYDVQIWVPRPYIVQEYIDGIQLGDWVKRTSPDLRTIVRILEQVASAVACAHKNRLYHRDLKPANILVDGETRPHVADFGIAVHEDAKEGLEGQLSGSPRYMAPEQTLRQASRIDGRTDVWSLGVMMYELLTGKHPFDDDETSGLFLRIQEAAPVPPSMLRATVPAELERICLKCLRKKQSDRYSTCDELENDLRAWRLRDEASDGRQRRLLIRSGVTIVALLTAAIIANVVMQAGRAEAIRTAVKSVANSSGEITEQAIQDLNGFPNHLLLDEIRLQIKAQESTNRPLMYALAERGVGDAAELLSLIKDVEGPEIGAFHRALTKLGCPPTVLGDSAATLTSSRDWKVKARVAVTAGLLGHESILGEMTADPAQRVALIIESCNWRSHSPAELYRMAEKSPDLRIQRAMGLAATSSALAVGYHPNQSTIDRIGAWVTSGDSALHSTGAWILNQLGKRVPNGKAPENSQWTTTPSGLTMLRIPCGPETEAFEICDREISWDLFEEFLIAESPGAIDDFLPRNKNLEHPALYVSGLDAMKFCNWLSNRENLAPSYTFDDGTWRFVETADGYRIPNRAEWELVALAGGEGAALEGIDEIAMNRFAVFSSDLQSPATKYPNAFGAYDTFGNALELTIENTSPNDPRPRLRGGAYVHPRKFMKSSTVFSTVPIDERTAFAGLRVARNATAPLLLDCVE